MPATHPQAPILKVISSILFSSFDDFERSLASKRKVNEVVEEGERATENMWASGNATENLTSHRPLSCANPKYLCFHRQLQFDCHNTKVTTHKVNDKPRNTTGPGHRKQLQLRCKLDAGLLERRHQPLSLPCPAASHHSITAASSTGRHEGGTPQPATARVSCGEGSLAGPQIGQSISSCLDLP